MKTWVKNRPYILLKEHDLQTIISYVEVGDRAIISKTKKFRRLNCLIREILPTGLKVRVWDGEVGTTHFFGWNKIVEIRKKLQIKQINIFSSILKKIYNFFKK